MADEETLFLGLLSDALRLLFCSLDDTPDSNGPLVYWSVDIYAAILRD